MHASNQIISLLVPLGLIGLIVTAGIALYRIRAFSLPISTATATATIILPVIAGISVKSAQTLARRGKRSFSRQGVAIFMLLVIYETAIATLALTHMAPPANLVCGLDYQWGLLFSRKNAEAIRRIQDRHQCCGLHSVVDRAWPFPDRSHTSAACVETFDRQQSCLGNWRRDTQVTGGLMLLVAVVVFLLKLLLLVVYRSRDPFSSATRITQSSHFPSADESVDANNVERHIRGQIEGNYRDEPLLANNEEADGSRANGGVIHQPVVRGPVMQPSGLRNEENNEWREV